MTETTEKSLPPHVEAVLVALAMVAPVGFVVLLVGPRETAVHLGIALYVALLVVGVAVAGLLERA